MIFVPPLLLIQVPGRGFRARVRLFRACGFGRLQALMFAARHGGA